MAIKNLNDTIKQLELRKAELVALLPQQEDTKPKKMMIYDYKTGKMREC